MDGLQVVEEQVEILVGRVHHQHHQVVLVVEELEVLLVMELLVQLTPEVAVAAAHIQTTLDKTAVLAYV